MFRLVTVRYSLPLFGGKSFSGQFRQFSGYAFAIECSFPEELIGGNIGTGEHFILNVSTHSTAIVFPLLRLPCLLLGHSTFKLLGLVGLVDLFYVLHITVEFSLVHAWRHRGEDGSVFDASGAGEFGFLLICSDICPRCPRCSFDFFPTTNLATLYSSKDVFESRILACHFSKNAFDPFKQIPKLLKDSLDGPTNLKLVLGPKLIGLSNTFFYLRLI